MLAVRICKRGCSLLLVYSAQSLLSVLCQRMHHMATMIWSQNIVRANGKNMSQNNNCFVREVQQQRSLVDSNTYPWSQILASTQLNDVHSYSNKEATCSQCTCLPSTQSVEHFAHKSHTPALPTCCKAAYRKPNPSALSMASRNRCSSVSLFCATSDIHSQCCGTDRLHDTASLNRRTTLLQKQVKHMDLLAGRTVISTLHCIRHPDKTASDMHGWGWQPFTFGIDDKAFLPAHTSMTDQHQSRGGCLRLAAAGHGPANSAEG